MWKRNQLHILTVATTLSSAAFCLHTVPIKPQERVIRHGTLFVGNQRNDFSNETKGGAGALGDTDGYQADQPEAEVGNQLAELKLQQLRPSVQCDNDSMTLRMVGKRVPDFLVERDGKSPVPLSELPAYCGLSVKRARRDIFLVAKYDSCHMTQEGDNYILPLRLWGVPVKMGCPVEALFLTVSCTLSAMVIQVGISVDSLKVKANGEWQPLAQACDTCGFTLEAVPSEWVVTAPYTSKCWQIEGDKRLLSVLYSNGELTLSCPLDTTPLPADEELPPVPPMPPVDYPFPYPGNQFWPFYLGYPGTPSRRPTTATTAATSPTAAATTVTPPSADERFWNPYGHARNWLFYSGYSGPPPKSPTPAPTTGTTTTNPTTAATTAKPLGVDERFWNPYGHARNWLFYPGYPGPPARSPSPTTPAPTTATTTSNPTTAAATTTTATTTTNPTTAATTAKFLSADERFWNPYGYPKHWLYYPSYPGAYGYPGAPPRNPTTTPAPTTATTTTNPTTAATTDKPLGADERFWNPYGYPKHWLYYPSYPGAYGYPGAPPRNPTTTPAPTTATTTTNPTTAATTAKPLGADERFWNPYGYPKHWLYYPSYPGAYGYPGAPPRNPTTTTTNPAPTSAISPTTDATKAKPPDTDERFWNPYWHAKNWRFYPAYSGGPPIILTSTASTSTASTSTASTTTTSTSTASTSTTTTPTTTTPQTSTIKPPPSADQQQHWSPFPWLPTMKDPSGNSNAGQAYQMPWMPYPPRHSGRDQKGLLPVATASVVNGDASVKQKWYYPMYQMPGAPQLQISAATRPKHHQGMPQTYLWPIYLSPSRQSSRDSDPKLTFDQMFASRGWSSLLYPAQLSPLQVKAGPVYKGSDFVPSR